MLSTVVEALRADLRARGAPMPAALSEPARAIHITSRWAGRAVYALFGPRDRTPSLVVKVDTDPAYQPRLRTEHETLCWHSASPQLAGRMPQPVGLVTDGSGLALAQTGVAGVPLNVLLRRRIRSGPARSARDHALFFDWLATLHRSMPRPAWVSFDAQRTLQEIRAALPDDRAIWHPFLQAMTGQAERYADLQMPLLPAHGDLGPSNCLVHGSSIGVIDWEGGVEPRDPLTDVVVFLNHYARALPTHRHQLPDPTEAFARAFLDHGWLAELTARSVRSELARLHLPVEAAPLLVAATLAELAAGKAGTAHGHRSGSRRNWSGLLAVYAEHFRTGPLWRKAS